MRARDLKLLSILCALTFALSVLFVVRGYLAMGEAPLTGAKITIALAVALAGCAYSRRANRRVRSPRIADRQLLTGTAVMVAVLYGMLALTLLRPLGSFFRPWEFVVFPVCTFTFFLRSQASFLLLGTIQGGFLFYSVLHGESRPVAVLVAAAFLTGYLLLLAILFLRERGPAEREIGWFDRSLPFRTGPVAALLLMDLLGLFLAVKPPAPLEPEPKPEGKPRTGKGIPEWLGEGFTPAAGPLTFPEKIEFGDQPGRSLEDRVVLYARLYDQAGKQRTEHTFPLFWRFAALSRWERGRWVQREGEGEILRGRRGNTVLEEAPVRGRGPPIEQRIILMPLESNALFALYPVRSISLPVVRLDPEGCLRRVSASPRMIRYIVRSRPLIRTRQSLVLGTPGHPDPAYLRVPTEIGSQPEFQTAYDRIRRDALNEVDFMEGMVRYFGGYEYTREPGFDPNEDQTLAFLKSKRGYCQHFASLGTLLLRRRGIPARVAIGFAGGDVMPDGTIAVRRRDAHAWIEVHFKEVGWVPIDPSAAARMGWDVARGPEKMIPTERGKGLSGTGKRGAEETGKTRLDEGEATRPAPPAKEEPYGTRPKSLFARLWDQAVEGARAVEGDMPAVASKVPEDDRPKTDGEFFRRLAVQDVLLLVAVLAFAGILLVASRGRRKPEASAGERDGPVMLSERPDSESGWFGGLLRLRTGRSDIVRTYTRFLERARRAGHPKPEHLTAREYRDHLEKQVPGLEGLDVLTDLFELARYGPTPPGPEEVSAARAASREVSRRLRGTT